MKKILIPLAAAAALSLNPAYAQNALGLGKDKPAATAGAGGVEASKDGATRDLKTPVGTVSTEASGEAVGASAAVGTAKSPKAKAGARVARGNKDKGIPPAASAGAEIEGAAMETDNSTGDRAKKASDKLVPESAK